MQLSAARWTTALAAAALCSLAASPAQAQSYIDITGTAYHESGGPLNMTVYTPGASLNIQIVDEFEAWWRYEADIVSGASVAIVDSPGSGVDAVTGATTLDDVRHVVSTGLGLERGNATLTAAGTVGVESDYISRGFSVGASTDLFGRNTQLGITYASTWDSVCDVAQEATEAVERRRLPNSEGCFSAEDRTHHAVRLHTFQGSWTQAWTPLLNTQLLLTAQLLNGFQSNPYRAVWLGRTAAQEYHPAHRARYAAGLRARVWLKPIGGALQLFGRAYRDTWDVRSVTAQLAYERTLIDQLRFRVRGRYYSQTGAAFYSDDYELQPAGQYFTGDRELSPMGSWLAGARLEYLPSGDEEGNVLRVLSQLRLVVKFSMIWFRFDDFHYDQVAVPNTRGLFGTLGINAVF